MTLHSYPISEEELGAYVDGAVEPARGFEIASYLANHPLAAARIEALRAQKEGIRALFGGAMDQPVPERLRQVMPQTSLRATPPRWVWAVVAALVTLVLLLGTHLLAAQIPLARDAAVRSGEAAAAGTPRDSGHLAPGILLPAKRRHPTDI
jgi:anti-sigma factor RsiW